MKNLNDYIIESLLDDFDELDKDVQQNAKKSIIKFLIDNYILNGGTIRPDDKKIKISNKPNKDGKYVVDVDDGLIIKNRDIYTLTNNIFVFGKVGGCFSCACCNNLTSLEGAPKEVKGYFDCSECEKLISLEGGLKEVGGGFFCVECSNLTTLKGAPQKVGGNFDCIDCKNLTSLEGAPKKVEGGFSCEYTNITSLKGAPKEVGGYFSCINCNKLKNLDYLPKEIGGSLYVPDHLQK
jgi:hypothetical protein